MGRYVMTDVRSVRYTPCRAIGAALPRAPMPGPGGLGTNDAPSISIGVAAKRGTQGTWP